MESARATGGRGGPKRKAIGQLNGWYRRLKDNYSAVGKISELTTDKNALQLIQQEKQAKMYLTLACTDHAFDYIIGKQTARDM